MARPKSEDKRIALLEAAVRVFAQHGLSAPTALIAKEAGVANGTLFTYFETKAELLQQLYLALKTEMVSAFLVGHHDEKDLKEQFSAMWSNWMQWATANPERMRVLDMLAVSEDVTPEIRSQANQLMGRITEILERIRVRGPLRDVPMAFAADIMTSLANATMGFMVNDPENADEHCKTGIEALWRVIA